MIDDFVPVTTIVQAPYDVPHARGGDTVMARARYDTDPPGLAVVVPAGRDLVAVDADGLAVAVWWTGPTGLVAPIPWTHRLGGLRFGHVPAGSVQARGVRNAEMRFWTDRGTWGTANLARLFALQDEAASCAEHQRAEVGGLWRSA